MSILQDKEKEFMKRKDILDAIDDCNFNYVFSAWEKDYASCQNIFHFLNDSDDGCCNFEKLLRKNMLNFMSFIPQFCFFNLDAITTFAIPNSITKIHHYGFAGNHNLQDVIIPDSVTEIDKSAFWDCGNLTICCHSGSFAEKYAKENHINYKII